MIWNLSRTESAEEVEKVSRMRCAISDRQTSSSILK